MNDTPTPSAAPAEPSPAQIASACMSYRHDFGLMDRNDRERLMIEAKAWLHAWRKEFEVRDAPKGEPTAEPVCTVYRGGLGGRWGKGTFVQAWLPGASALPDGETNLYAAPPAQPSPTMADAPNMRVLSAEAQARLESIRVPLPTAEERKAQSDAIERVRDKALGSNAGCEICKQPCGERWCSRCLNANPKADAIAAGEPTDWRDVIKRARDGLAAGNRSISATDFEIEYGGALIDSIEDGLERLASSAGTPHDEINYDVVDKVMDGVRKTCVDHDGEVVISLDELRKIVENALATETCPTCGECEPHTGSCGTSDSDTKALCKRRASSAGTPHGEKKA